MYAGPTFSINLCIMVALRIITNALECFLRPKPKTSEMFPHGWTRNGPQANMKLAREGGLGRETHLSAFVIMCIAIIIHELILVVRPAYTDNICGPDAQNQLTYHAYTT